MTQSKASWVDLYESSLTMLLYINSSLINIIQNNNKIKSNRSLLYFLLIYKSLEHGTTSRKA